LGILFRFLFTAAAMVWHYRCVHVLKQHMKQNELNAPDHREGSGSAGNMGRDRSEQKNTTSTSDTSRMEEATGSKQHLVNLHDMGSLGGRDDYAGGSGDNMAHESTDESTER
jgi:hypothetical protein